MFLKLLLYILLVFGVHSRGRAYNLSPVPSIIVKKPINPLAPAHNRSAYFGYSIVLREKSVLIGAPRTVSSFRGEYFAETGAIFKYNLTSSDLKPFVFEDADKIPNKLDLTFDFREQWLGGTMDGGPKDTDKFLACAPRLNATYENIQQYMHGVCYWSENTLSNTAAKSNTSIVSPLSNDISRQLQIRKGDVSFNYIFAQQGFSAFIDNNNGEIVMGAPGVDNWNGAVIHYDMKTGVSNTMRIRASWYTYAGYAVAAGQLRCSAIEPNLLNYVFTVPRTNETDKAVNIYRPGSKGRPKIYATLHGEQYGEYFGYAVVVDDVNGDGLDDVLVSAPQHSSKAGEDFGAVYVFINLGRCQFQSQFIASPFQRESGGRFGTTISKLGDINLDGYKDIAIGAPFVGNQGAVAIYLGSADGLSPQPSQILNASSLDPLAHANAMYGHGLSKGVDIDANGFNDLAVGAPNADAVFIHRAFPVVRINATVQASPLYITTDEDQLEIEICFNILTNSTTIEATNVILELNMDSQIKRVTLLNEVQHVLEIEVLAGLQPNCRQIDAQVKFIPKHVFEPMHLELSWQPKYDGTQYQGEDFCENCVVMDPTWKRFARSTVRYKHGCKSSICNVDLNIKSVGLPEQFVLGTAKTLTAAYSIRNTGEKAFDAQLIVSTSLSLPIAKMPADCMESDDSARTIVCELAKRQAFTGNATLEITFDIGNLAGVNELVANASVTSTGNELTPADNIASNVIVMQTIAKIDIIDISKNDFRKVQEYGKYALISSNYTIQNNGPSDLHQCDLWLTLPLAFIQEQTNTTLPFVNYTRSFARVRMDGISIPPLPFNSTPTMDWDTKLNALELAKIAETFDLPENRTAYLYCGQMETITCAASHLVLPYLKVGHNITVHLRYRVQIEAIKSFMVNPIEYLAIVPNVFIRAQLPVRQEDLSINKFLKAAVMVNIIKEKTPLWVYILSGIGGLVFLAVLITVLRRWGFFKRQTKADMQKLLEEKEEKARMKAELDKCMEVMDDYDYPDYMHMEEVDMVKKENTDNF